jgi:outer membrane receptor protein involved in Fe transport
MKTSYMVSCAVAAILSGGGAAMAADAPAAPAAGAAAPSTGIEEVVVTAQRRSESVEKVPMTVQAFSGATLTKLNVVTLDDILKYTPNVTYGNNGAGQGEIFMRGLSNGFRGNQSSSTVGPFPNVAIYLDDQSMQFPGRNADVYMADMERVEVLEGPQGTLFGGGAEAGAVRYITNKPKLNVYEGSAEGSYGFTSGGANNDSIQAMINLPLIKDKLAVRAVVYNDHHGGYIDNVPSTFTRSNEDLGNFYFGITPTGGLCPNGKPAGAAGFCAPPSSGPANNYGLVRKNQNPLTYTGGRVAVKYEINPDWDVLITESMQTLDAEGLSVDYPIGSDFQALKPLQVTAFSPSYDKDRFENTSWTFSGKIGDLKAIYTGGYTVRHISQQMEYSNYSRSVEGQYYACTGGSTGWGGPNYCYSPVSYWQDTVRNTHMSHEVRLSTPDDWQVRGLIGAYYEHFRIYDQQNFFYKNIPSCDAANLSAALAGGAPCVANVTTDPVSTSNDPGERPDHVAFGEDTQRGYDQTAIFGSIDYDVIPNVLTLTAGTRWFQYNEFEVGSQFATGTGCLDVPNGQCVGGLTDINSHHDKATYVGFKNRAVVTWHINRDSLAYFLFSQGFRPGAFNRSNSKTVISGPGGSKQFLEPNAYKPDTLTNYEVGAKTQLFDHRLQLNVSAYYMTWNNVQFLLFDPPYSINTTFGINGPNYHVKGVEAQAVAKPWDGLTVQGSISYNDATESKAPCLTDNISGTPDFGQCITQATPKGGTLGPFPNPFGLVGSTPAFSPKVQADIRGRYDWSVGDYNPYVTLGVNYTGSMYNQPASYTSGAGVLIPFTTYLRYLQPAYTTLDASIGVTKDKWFAEVYATNLTDSHASTFTSSAQFIKSEVPLRPRVVMLKLGAHF